MASMEHRGSQNDDEGDSSLDGFLLVGRERVLSTCCRCPVLVAVWDIEVISRWYEEGKQKSAHPVCCKNLLKGSCEQG